VKHQYTVKYANQASLAVLGQWQPGRAIWQGVAERVQIPQKTVRHRPIDKLQDIFIHILSGSGGLVAVNSGLRSQIGLQRAFGRQTCAEQSTLSQTLNACTSETVAQLRAAVTQIYRQWGQAQRHDFQQELLLLDVDLSGLPAGRLGEGVTKGFFSEHKHRRGRQLGRVHASQYDEIVAEQLYPGNVQLESRLADLLTAAEAALPLSPQQRQRTVVRLDGGGGTDQQIDGLLSRGYRLIAKVKNWQRSCRLARSVLEWQPDPKAPSREVGWASQPHAYVRPTRQLVIRSQARDGQWRYRVLVFDLEDADLNRLAGTHGLDGQWAALYAYDLRGGGVETSHKNSKQGLGLTQRNKRRWAAQEMLVLLAELAYNLLSWFRAFLARHAPGLRQVGMLRLVRDVLGISGKLYLDPQGRVLKIVLNQAHGWASQFQQACGHWPRDDGWALILRQI
jgi:hypothetical protein